MVSRVAAPSTTSVATKQPKKDIEGPSTDPSVIYERLQRVRSGRSLPAAMRAVATSWQGPPKPILSRLLLLLLLCAAGAAVLAGVPISQVAPGWCGGAHAGDDSCQVSSQPGGEMCATAGNTPSFS